MKSRFQDPFIAMTFFAILFFIILVLIFVLWCKRRRQTEVKTVVIQPKKRPVSTKPVKQVVNGGNEHANGGIDIEAGLGHGEIELDDEDTSHVIKTSSSEESEQQNAEPEASAEPEPSVESQANVESQVNVEPQAHAAEVPEVKESVPSDQPTQGSIESNQGETNPSFEQD